MDEHDCREEDVDRDREESIDDLEKERVEKRVDEDWKRSAQMERDRIFEERPERDPGRFPEASLTFLVSNLHQQAMMSLSGALQGGPMARQELAQAKLNIDLIQVIKKKTVGNLTPEESQLVDEALRDAQTKFVQLGSRLR